MKSAPAPRATSVWKNLGQRATLLLGLEAAAACSSLLALALPAARRAHAANLAPLWFRVLAIALPVLGALLALWGGAVWLRSRPERAVRLRSWVRAGAPVLALWPLPALLDHPAFAEQPVFLLLATGAVALGLERSWRYAAASWRGWRRSPRWVALAAGAGAPRVLAALAIVATALFLALGSIGLHARMSSSIYDLGLFENLFWNTLHGRHGIALGERYFAEHAELLLYLLMPFYALAPRAETLLVLQAALMAGAAVPLYLLAERWLHSAWAALVLALAYLAHPALHGPAFYDFHFLPLSAFFLLWAVYFHARRPGGPAFWIAVSLALCCREDVAVGIAALGAGLAWNARRGAGYPCRSRVSARTFRVGLLLLGLGLVWFLSVKYVWMRQFGRGRFSSYYSELIAPPAKGFGGVLLTLVSNPLYTLSRLCSEQKLLLGLQLLVPVAFLPLRYARAWFLLLPGLLVVGLANSESAIVNVYYHYATHFLPLVFVAALYALAVRSRRARVPALLALACASWVSAARFSAFQGPGEGKPFSQVSFRWSAEDEARQEAFRTLAALIPAQASLCAGEHEGAQLARRATLRALKLGIDDADYVLYSARSLRWGGREQVASALEQSQYGVVASAGDLVLLARDHDPALNARALSQLR